MLDLEPIKRRMKYWQRKARFDVGKLIAEVERLRANELEAKRGWEGRLTGQEAEDKTKEFIELMERAVARERKDIKERLSE